MSNNANENDLFKLCFLLMQVERSNSKSNDNNDIINKLSYIYNSILITNNGDVMKAFPFIFSSISRLLSKSVSNNNNTDDDTLNISDIKLSFACIELCEKILLRIININEIKTFFYIYTINIPIIQEKDGVKNHALDLYDHISKLLILLTATLESIKIKELKIIEKNSSLFLSGDYEAIVMSTFNCYIILINSIWMNNEFNFNCDNNNNLYNNLNTNNNNESYRIPDTSSINKITYHKSLTGPFLAQLIQCCLYYARHKNRKIAQGALYCLISLVRYIDDVNIWKSFLPGTFSGLYNVCLSGSYVGSQVLLPSLVCLLLVTNRVCNDNIDCNIKLNKSNANKMRSNNNNDNELNTVDLLIEKFHAIGINASVNKDKDQNDKMNNIDMIDNKNIEIQEKNLSNNDDELMEYRVKVLTRIASSLPKAFNETMKVCKSNQKCVILTTLYDLINTCHHYFGQQILVQFLILLVKSLDDEYFIVRKTAKYYIQQLKYNNNNNKSELWSNIEENLQELFLSNFRSLEECSSTSNTVLDNDNKVGKILSIILGLGEVINSIPSSNTDIIDSDTNIDFGDEDKLVVMVRNEAKYIVKSVEKLLVPDINIGLNVIGLSNSFVLESRNYYFNYYTNNSNIKSNNYNCQYYRTSILVAQEEVNIKKIRKLCYLLGTNGAISNIVDKCNSNQRKLERNDIRSRSVYNKYNNNHDDLYDPYKLISNDQSIYQLTNSSLSLTSSNEYVESTQQIELKETYKELKEETLIRLKNSISLMHFLMMTSLSLIPSWSYYKEKSNKLQKTSNEEISSKQDIENKVKCNFCHDILLKPRKCSRCTKVSYCSIDHQKLDWDLHKRVCIKSDSNISSSSSSSNNNSSSDKINDNNDSKSISNLEIDDEITIKDIIIDANELLIKVNVIFDYQKDINNNKKMKIKTKLITDITRICMVEMKYYLNWESLNRSIVKLNNSNTLTPSLVEKMYRIHLVSLSIECIANCCLILGYNYRLILPTVLYPLLELLVDSDEIINITTKSTLYRLAMYMKYDSFTDLIRANLNFIVDVSCAILRNNSQNNDNSNNNNIVARTHLIIDLVFSEIGNEIFDETSSSSSSTSALSLLKDMVLDTVENIDMIASKGLGNTYSGNYSPYLIQEQHQITSVLKIMKVLIDKASTPVSLSSSSSSSSSLLSSSLLSSSILESTTLLLSNKELIEEIVSKSLNTFEVHMETLCSDEDVFISDNNNLDNDPSNMLNKDINNEIKDENLDKDDDNANAKPTTGLQLILDMLEKCCFFFSLPNLQQQVIVMEAMSLAFMRLANNRLVLLPAIHKSWPTLMGRLKQQVKLFQSINHVISNQNNNKLAIKVDNFINNTSYNRDINSIFSSSASSSSSSTFTSTSIQKNKNQVSMLLLPQLLELFELLTNISGDFLIMKFKDDLWPLLSEILVHNLDNELIILQNKQISIKNKVKLNKDSISNIINNTQSTTSEKKNANNLYHDVDKFSVDTKIKTSILKFIISISNNKFCFNFIRSITSPLIWLVLPLLLSHQSDIVIELAHHLILILMKIDPSLIISFIGSITDNIYLDNECGYEIICCNKEKDYITNEFWSSIITIPSIVEIMNKNKNNNSSNTMQFNSVYGGDRILSSYKSDSKFITRLNNFITSPSSISNTNINIDIIPDMYDVCMFDSYWINNELPRWNQV